jgi:hypothetical protein
MKKPWSAVVPLLVEVVMLLTMMPDLVNLLDVQTNL